MTGGTEHLAEIESLDGTYRRGIDGVVVAIKDGTVIIGSDVIHLSPNPVRMGVWELVEKDADQLIWSNGDERVHYFRVPQPPGPHLNLPAAPTTPPGELWDNLYDKRLKRFASITIIPLRDPDFLRGHLSDIESHLRQAGLMKGNIVVGEIVINLKNRMLESLNKFNDMYNHWLDLMNTGKRDYCDMRDSLVANFASDDQLKKSVEKRLRKLRFTGTDSVNRFIDRCTEINTLFMSVFSDDTYERKNLLQKLLAKIDDDIGRTLLRTFKEKLGNQWYYSLPIKDNKPNEFSFCSTLRHECENISELEGFRYSSSGELAGTSRKPDSQFSPNPRPNIPRQQPGTDYIKLTSLNGWYTLPQFKTIVTIQGAGCRDADIEHKMKSAGFETRRYGSHQLPSIVGGTPDSFEVAKRKILEFKLPLSIRQFIPMERDTAESNQKN
jgi:hypothetical protein